MRSPTLVIAERGLMNTLNLTILPSSFHSIKSIPVTSISSIFVSKTRQACLVFETKIDEIEVTGIDLIEWNDDGKMVKLSVFIRPLSAITKVGERMSKKLSEMT